MPKTALVFVVAILVASGVLGVVPLGAATSSSKSYSLPTWWTKFQFVSSHSATLTADDPTKTVAVGPNVDVSNEAGPQSETSLSINPSNAKQLVGGSNEIFRLPMRGYFSSDGGATWGAVDLPLPGNTQNSAINFGSDPGVAWDARGNVFYSYIIVFFNQKFAAVTATEMAVARSSDGGSTWTSTYFGLTTGQSLFNDKPYIAVDTNPSSPFFNRVYVAWDRIDNGVSTHNNMMVSFSSDGGKTFSAPIGIIAGVGQKVGIGADPFVGPDGTLFVAWHDIFNNQLVMSTSTDGGNSFSTIHTISPTVVPFAVGIPAMNTRRALLYPACGADTSSGPNRGTVYCSWMDETSTSGTDIFVSRSSDHGATWSAPLRVNDDPVGTQNDQFNQWLAVDSSDGSVSLSWYDTRNDPSHLSTDVFYAKSTDGGHTFSKNVQVTTAPTNETCCGADLGNQYGDYEGLAAFGGVAHPFWTDRRASVASLDEEVFTATVTLK